MEAALAVIFAAGGPDSSLGAEARRGAVRAALEHASDPSRTLILPPDGTRPHAGAGTLTRMLCEELPGRATVHVMPALGTHRPMSRDELAVMFGTGLPADAFREHRWREDLLRLGSVPSGFVHQVSDGVLREWMPDYEVPVEVNRCLVEGGYGAIISVGQVLPHEVAGMANGFKNVLVGAGGRETINRTHFLGAAYGMERMMGRADTPVRAVLTYAHEHYLAELGIVYIMTVMEPDPEGEVTMRGIFVGDDNEAFLMAAELSRQVNLTVLERPRGRAVAYLAPNEFKSTWLGNKAIYRTRMAIADGGELTVLAPAVAGFGEDAEIDRLIRRYGYRGTRSTLEATMDNEELRDNLSAAAHLIHGSSEGRFRVVYATNHDLLSREEVEGVGFEWMDVADALEQYPPGQLRDGDNDGFYFVRCPALGLWATRERFGD
jgi:nickel-dependent lactate racemase